MPLTLIGGGSRSGKSRQALELARSRGERRAFVATAQAFDQEMSDRIAKHRADRGSDFVTFEEPIDVARVLRTQGPSFDSMVIDCLTLWLSNLILAGTFDSKAETERLMKTAAALPNLHVIAVTNEVGCGIVPENALARRFRDEAGSLNQQVAAAAREVYWMAFGCALRMK